MKTGNELFCIMTTKVVRCIQLMKRSLKWTQPDNMQSYDDHTHI